MSKSEVTNGNHSETTSLEAVIRQHAEQQFAEELAEIKKIDDRQRPPNWVLSPWAVRTYVLGGRLPNGFEVTPKYIGNARLVEIAVATLATDRALLLYGVPGTAKCVKHDMLVLDTRTGQRITIAEACRKRDLKLASLQTDYRLRGQVPTDYINNGIRPCYRVTTALGREIEVTLNHPFLTTKGWQPLADLKPGDRVAQPRAMAFFGHARCSEARVKLLAHFIASGQLLQQMPGYTGCSADMRRDFGEAMQEAFPTVAAYWDEDGCWHCTADSNQEGDSSHSYTAWLHDLGLMWKDSARTFVPEIVFALPRRQIALFLNRLFSSGGSLDLHLTAGQISVDYTSASKRLIKDVQHLLLRFGMHARISVTEVGQYRLSIEGLSACRSLLREIGLSEREVVAEALTLLDDIYQSTLTDPGIIPSQVENRLKLSDCGTSMGSGGTFITADCERTVLRVPGSAISREHGQSRISASLAIDNDQSQLVQSDIYWDSIEAIEPIGEHEVYDLSMEETHNFVANDFIIHNSWLSEHLSAAIAGNSTLLIQGTAGTDESAIRYGWNYARLLVEGPTPAALVVSPMMNAMQNGKIARIEELTRIPSEVQDTLITILSEKTLPVPELNTEVQACKGFNVIATANNRDKGVNELSSALMRRFNTVILPVPDSMDEEIDIVERRVTSLGKALELPAEKPALEEIRRVVTVFRELRSGVTTDGKTKVKSPSGTLSTAEAISVISNGLAMAGYYGDGQLKADDLAASLTGAIVKDPVQDRVVWLEYLQTVVKERDGWKDLYRACHDVL